MLDASQSQHTLAVPLLNDPFGSGIQHIALPTGDTFATEARPSPSFSALNRRHARLLKTAIVGQSEQLRASGDDIALPYPRCRLRELRQTCRASATLSEMEMIMKKIMCMVALGLALLGTGQSAFAQNVRTGSAVNEPSVASSAAILNGNGAQAGLISQNSAR